MTENHFIPTLADNPREAQVVSHQLLLRAGYIRQVAAGIYNYLPLGVRVMRKIEAIIRREMNAAGAQEILMPFVQPAELWQESGRWEKYEAKDKIMLRFQDRNGNWNCLQPTSEDVVTALFRDNVQSYKQLPLNLYQIQTKFRDEIRPRFGLLRGREFVMKDAYSFDVSKEAALESYEKMRVAYNKIFTAFGLDYRMVAADSGDIGGDYSHEFHVLAKTGEDELIFDPAGDYAVNVEKYDPATAPKPRDQLDTKRGIEIGHIFYLGTVYSAPMGANIQMDGKLQPVHMGCYGIGVSRLIGAAIEQNNDANGIIWPRAIAPYDVHLLNLRPNDAECSAAVAAEKASLESQGLEVLVDDSDDSAGAKFTKADLIGIPFQCAIGPKGVKAGMAEWKTRATGEKTERKLGAKFEG